MVATEDRILEVRGVSNWSSLKMLEHQEKCIVMMMMMMNLNQIMRNLLAEVNVAEFPL